MSALVSPSSRHLLDLAPQVHPLRVIRIFNTYGPRMDPEDGRVVSEHRVTERMEARYATAPLPLAMLNDFA